MHSLWYFIMRLPLACLNALLTVLNIVLGVDVLNTLPFDTATELARSEQPSRCYCYCTGMLATLQPKSHCYNDFLSDVESYHLRY
jgi:hypothetical protein